MSDWIQSIGLFFALIGLIITILNNKKQIVALNDQLKLNFFSEYTKRYQDILLNLPLDIYHNDFSFSELPEDVRNITLKYMRAYFDLCSEELDLYNAKHIHERIWVNWKEGIEASFSKKAFIDAWDIIKLETIYYPAFSKWIDELIREGKAKMLNP